MRMLHPGPSEILSEKLGRMTILLRLLAQRTHEWQTQRGLPRIITRIKVALWAWKETARQQRRGLRKLE